MKIWRLDAKKKKWKKKHIPRRLAKQPLLTLLAELVRKEKGDFYVVFSTRDVSRLEATGRKLFPRDTTSAFAVLDAALQMFQPSCRGPICATYAPEYEAGSTGESRCRLAIHFKI